MCSKARTQSRIDHLRTRSRPSEAQISLLHINARNLTISRAKIQRCPLLSESGHQSDKQFNELPKFDCFRTTTSAKHSADQLASCRGARLDFAVRFDLGCTGARRSSHLSYHRHGFFLRRLDNLHRFVGDGGQEFGGR